MSRSNPARHSFPTRRSSDLALAHAIAAHFAARRDDPTHELVADHEAGLDHALRPLVPVVDVQVSAADRGLLRSEERRVGKEGRYRWWAGEEQWRVARVLGQG